MEASDGLALIRRLDSGLYLPQQGFAVAHRHAIARVLDPVFG